MDHYTPTRHRFPPSSWPRVAAVSWVLFGVMATWAFLAPSSRWDEPPTDAELLRWVCILAAGIVCLLPMLLPANWLIHGWSFRVCAALLILWAATGISLWVALLCAMTADIGESLRDWGSVWTSAGMLAFYLLATGGLLVAFWLRPVWLTLQRLRALRENGTSCDGSDLEELPEDAICVATPGE